jgi:hypothetical protein
MTNALFLGMTIQADANTHLLKPITEAQKKK